jgi:hypothetical protein
VLTARYYDLPCGVYTRGLTSKEEWNLSAEEWRKYSSECCQHIFNALKRLSVETSESVVLDYGCGKGRELIAVAQLATRELLVSKFLGWLMWLVLMWPA